jgi:DHA1 family tetracycline resistance protein-like MFS transporter
MSQPVVAAPAVTSRTALAFVLVTVFLDMAGFGIMLPVFPKLVLALQSGDVARAATTTGLFISVWAAMQFLCSPLVGSLSDRFGRRRIIILSNVGVGLDYLLMAAAPSLPWLFAGRLISGMTSSTVATAGAYIADVTAAEERAARFGMLGAACGLGFILGPMLGGVLGGVGLRVPFWTAAALSLANAAYGYFVLPESLPAERRGPVRWRSANPIGAVGLLRSHADLAALATVGYLATLAYDAAPTTFVLYATDRYSWNERTVGLVMGTLALAALMVQGLLVGRVVAALGERRALAIGLACGATGMAIYGLAPSGSVFLAGIPFTAVYGLSHPSLQSLMARWVAPTEQGRLQGAQGSLTGIAGTVAPILFNQTLALAIGRWRDLGLPGAPFLLASALYLVALVIATGRARGQSFA